MKQLFYKIVEIDDQGRIKSLYHGNEGSRVLKKNRWMKAQTKLVRDGSSAVWYSSGWHCLPSYRECQNYLKKFKILHNKRIAACKVKNIWRKSHSRENVWLAKDLIIKEILDE